ncbi:hypothetical protein HDU96_003336 [Phlyctochytrium bullatum]|nr:hypothetical protein HDU96_003336 [Phlyctochytrium bullatum]
MKPYFRRVPVDDPTAIATATKDDFEAELEAWKSMKPVHKRPAFKVAKADLDPDDPEFYIERLDKHSLNAREKRYYYHVKWLGHGTCHNLWLPESEIPAAVVTDYWERIQVSKLSEYPARAREERAPRLTEVDDFDIPLAEDFVAQPPDDPVLSYFDDRAPEGLDDDMPLAFEFLYD